MYANKVLATTNLHTQARAKRLPMSLIEASSLIDGRSTPASCLINSSESNPCCPPCPPSPTCDELSLGSSE